MPEAHRYLPRDIEAKAKGGSNFSFFLKKKKRGIVKFPSFCTNEIVNVQSSNSTERVKTELATRVVEMTKKPSLHCHGSSVGAGRPSGVSKTCLLLHVLPFTTLCLPLACCCCCCC
jgi:hypothetical protein